MVSKKELQPVDDTKGSDKKVSSDPYLDARREWNERYGSYISRAKNWRLMAFGILGICLVQTVGLVVMATQNKIATYVVEVNKLGSATSVVRADLMGKTDERVIKSLLARFISDTRSVVSDGVAQRQMIDRSYAMLSNGTRALTIINEYYKNDPPFARAATVGVNTDISSVIPVTDKTWQVEWEETTRSTSGAIVSKLRWKANLTLAFNAPNNERQIRVNPIGVFVIDLNWSQVL